MSTSIGCTVTIRGKELPPPRHICCFFDSRDQQYETLTPYIAEGLSNGEKVMSVMDSDLFDDHHQRLKKGGVAVETAQQSGHLCTFSTDETYLKGGRFAKARMLSMLDSELKQIAGSRYSRLRTCGDMSWLMRNTDSVAEALEYESDVNKLLDTYDASFMCVYDVNNISGSMMRDILNTHSHVLMCNVIYDNPYYVTPEAYRQSLAARRSATTRLSGTEHDVH
jgi:hypothetical protein